MPSVSFVPFVDYFPLGFMLEYVKGDVISALFQGIFEIRDWLVKIHSIDEISGIIFEINFESSCSIDGGWLDFFV